MLRRSHLSVYDGQQLHTPENTLLVFLPRQIVNTATFLHGDPVSAWPSRVSIPVFKRFDITKVIVDGKKCVVISHTIMIPLRLPLQIPTSGEEEKMVLIFDFLNLELGPCENSAEKIFANEDGFVTRFLGCGMIPNDASIRRNDNGVFATLTSGEINVPSWTLHVEFCAFFPEPLFVPKTFSNPEVMVAAINTWYQEAWHERGEVSVEEQRVGIQKSDVSFYEDMISVLSGVERPTEFLESTFETIE